MCVCVHARFFKSNVFFYIQKGEGGIGLKGGPEQTKRDTIDYRS